MLDAGPAVGVEYLFRRRDVPAALALIAVVVLVHAVIVLAVPDAGRNRSVAVCVRKFRLWARRHALLRLDVPHRARRGDVSARAAHSCRAAFRSRIGALRYALSGVRVPV